MLNPHFNLTSTHTFPLSLTLHLKIVREGEDQSKCPHFEEMSPVLWS